MYLLRFRFLLFCLVLPILAQAQLYSKLGVVKRNSTDTLWLAPKHLLQVEFLDPQNYSFNKKGPFAAVLDSNLYLQTTQANSPFSHVVPGIGLVEARIPLKSIVSIEYSTPFRQIIRPFTRLAVSVTALLAYQTFSSDRGGQVAWYQSLAWGIGGGLISEGVTRLIWPRKKILIRNSERFQLYLPVQSERNQ